MAYQLICCAAARRETASRASICADGLPRTMASSSCLLTYLMYLPNYGGSRQLDVE